MTTTATTTGGGEDQKNGKTSQQSYEDLGTHHLTKSQDLDGRQPHEREFRFSRRENTEFKWKHDPTVIGGLEVCSEPFLDIHAPMKKHEVLSCEDDFQACLKIWNETKVRESFIRAFESIAPATKCCGLITDYDSTVKQNVPVMNKKWSKAVSDKPEWKDKNYSIDLFVWRWSNPTGKAETVILMIRFHKSK
jgi:hypothetical protein